MEDGGRRLHDALHQRSGTAAGFGPSANYNAKVILRFYCALAALGVVSAASTLAALQACVAAAIKVATGAPEGGDVREWLPYADFLVEAALLALPWGARALQENAAEAWVELQASVDGYLAARGEVCNLSGMRMRSASLRHQRASRVRARRVEPARRARACVQVSLELALWQPSDGDAATPPNVNSAFVASTWAALKDALGPEAALRTIPQPQACVDNAFNMSAVFEVPAVEVPAAPPVATGDFDRRGVAVQQAYPPRAVLPLLPAHLERHPDTMTTADCLVMQVLPRLRAPCACSPTQRSAYPLHMAILQASSGMNAEAQRRSAASVVQEYYLHVLQAYAANGSACVEEVTTGVPAPFPAVSLLVELLISQLLLPAPPLTVFGYLSMLVRLVEHLGQPLAMCAPLATTRRFVSKMDSMRSVSMPAIDCDAANQPATQDGVRRACVAYACFTHSRWLPSIASACTRAHMWSAGPSVGA